ncbi:MFS transporter [Frankia sp. AgB32]|uniref:MFS transporter n=1 Tax=Frankia sp. AgB32 TaxID=631119 RepID=UPI00200F9C6B|nr:MFS transporter [Frankia sp. AgB32]MCK9894012.1 MFS transporter [Frankia sp. AgB32]
MAERTAAPRVAARPVAAGRRVLAPLALAQFICSFAGSNMNVMINDISADLNTTVQGVQLVITLFLLVMAALMIPGGRLTDIVGRQWCLRTGLMIFGAGAVISAVAPSLGVLILGNSILEGVGTALLIPSVYILTTLLFTETAARARAFGMIMAAGGVGAAAGPLLGGLITSAWSWRAAFAFQALIVALVLVLSRSVTDPLPADPQRPFDVVGAVQSAAGLTLVVMGVLAASHSLTLTVALLVAGVLVLAWFLHRARVEEAAGREPLLSISLFHSRVANLGMITQNLQWLVLMGTSFTVAAYLQVVRGYDAIETGLIFTSATVGMLATSLAAARFARRHPPRTLIMTGFGLTAAGTVILIALGGTFSNPWASAPGLLTSGIGIGMMLTPSVTVVQSAFPEQRQGEISGLSRSVSNLGSSLGTAIAGTILVAGLTTHAYAAALVTLVVLAVAGLACAALLPRPEHASTTP